MTQLRKKIYLTAGYNTISMGTGRKEFNPKKPRPDLEDYLKEAGQGVLKQIGGAKNVDETYIGNFIASRFNRQGHMGAFAPFIDEGLRFKPSYRLESACSTGSTALLAAIRSVLAETADVTMAVGVEVQNTVKAIYTADYLAAAGWAKDRKTGHTYFFPGQFSDRAGSYYEKFGRDKTRLGMATWFKNAVENARLDPTAQEYHNTMPDLLKVGLTEPNANSFLANINVFDCSKVSDAACGIVVTSEEGLKRIGVDKKDCVEVVAFATAVDDITKKPEDPTMLVTTKSAVEQVLKNAGITMKDIATVELHDCFTIAAVEAVEAMGLAKHGEGADFIAAGNTSRTGILPMNTTGGLIGWGHPTGATGVHQAIVLWQQLTNKAGNAQIIIPADKPYGMSINMGGDDKTVNVIIYKKVL